MLSTSLLTPSPGEGLMDYSQAVPWEPWEIPWDMWEGKDSPGRLSFCFTKEELVHAELCKVSPLCQVWRGRVFHS